MRFETDAIHKGETPNLLPGGTGDVVMPIHLSSTFAKGKLGDANHGYEYSRTGNPTRNALEEKLAALENAKFGLAFSSGMAAQTTLLLSILNPGNHIAAFDDLYGGTKRFFETVLKKFGIKVSYVDATIPERVASAITKDTKAVWLESPTNPLLKLCDIGRISKLVREIRNNIIIVVDNTFASPFFQKPLMLGADVVVHSTTKYINGHSDSVGGAIMLSDRDMYEKLRFNQNNMGMILSPFDSFLVMRGIKTLALRMRKHEENAMRIAVLLEKHRAVKRVFYPGLRSHPQHEIAKRQMSGFGGVVSFEIKGGLRAARRFLESLKLFSLAESLGGVESLIEQPASMTHAAIPKYDRQKLGITDGLIRISAGIEDADDLLGDIARGLKSIESWL